MYIHIHMKKKLTLFFSYCSFENLGIWLVKTKLGMHDQSQAEKLNQLALKVSSCKMKNKFIA